MGNVVIKIDTGFVGATHEEDTGYTVEEWKKMTDQARQEWMLESILERIDAYAVDEDTNEVIE